MYYDKYRQNYGNNLVLRDMKYYWKQRQTMNNVKDYSHVLRAFMSAYKANPWAASKFDLDHAKLVLTRLARLEASNKNSE